MKGLLRCLRYDWPLHFVLLLTNWLPDNVVFLRLRGALARPFFASCGTDLRLGRNITFYNPASIFFEKSIYIAFGCWFMAGEKIFVGDETIFGPYCVVASSNHTRLHGSFRFGPPAQSPVRIGRGVWVASHVVITAGTEIGDGSLIAAGSVVNGDIPASVLSGGLPAKIIKELTNE